MEGRTAWNTRCRKVVSVISSSAPQSPMTMILFDTLLLFCHNREHSAGELFSKRGDALIEFAEDKNFALGQHTFENRNFVVETNVVYA